VLVSTALAASACVSNGAAAGARAGVRGVVLLGPLCPVQRQDSPCPDRPDAAGTVVATTRSGEDGRFVLGLDPGRYVLAATSGQGLGGGGKPVDVVVADGRFAQITLRVDTGIR